jgi:hypothetical protein
MVAENDEKNRMWNIRISEKKNDIRVAISESF